MKNNKIMISSIISLFVLAAFFVGLTVNFGNFKNAKGTEKIGRDVEKIDYKLKMIHDEVSLCFRSDKNESDNIMSFEENNIYRIKEIDAAIVTIPVVYNREYLEKFVSEVNSKNEAEFNIVRFGMEGQIAPSYINYDGNNFLITTYAYSDAINATDEIANKEPYKTSKEYKNMYYFEVEDDDITIPTYMLIFTDKEFDNYKSFNEYYIDNNDEFDTFRISIYGSWKELESAEPELLKKIDNFQK